MERWTSAALVLAGIYCTHVETSLKLQQKSKKQNNKKPCFGCFLKAQPCKDQEKTTKLKGRWKEAEESWLKVIHWTLRSLNLLASPALPTLADDGEAQKGSPKVSELGSPSPAGTSLPPCSMNAATQPVPSRLLLPTELLSSQPGWSFFWMIQPQGKKTWKCRHWGASQQKELNSSLLGGPRALRPTYDRASNQPLSRQFF